MPVTFGTLTANRHLPYHPACCFVTRPHFYGLRKSPLQLSQVVSGQQVVIIPTPTFATPPFCLVLPAFLQVKMPLHLTRFSAPRHRPGSGRSKSASAPWNIVRLG